MPDALSKSFADDLPFEDVIDDIIIYSDGSVGCAYEITPLYLDSMEYGAIMDFERTLCGFIDTIGQGVSVQVVWRKIKKLKALDLHLNQIESGDPLLQMMADGRHNFWNEKRENGERYGISCQIWIRKPYPRESMKPLNDIWDTGMNETSFINRYLEEQQEISEDFMVIADRMIFPIQSSLKARRMTSAEIFRSLWSYLCGQDDRMPEYRPDIPLKFRFDAVDVSKNYGYITIGNSDERVFNVLSARDLPEYSYTSAINYLLDIPNEFTLVMNLGSVQQGVLKNKLRKALTRNSSVIMDKIDPDAAKRTKELITLIDDLNNSTNKIVKMEMFMIVPDYSLYDLNNKVKHIMDIALDKLSIRFEPEKAALWNVFLASIPGACRCGTVKRDFFVKSTNAANFMPVLGPMTSSSRGIMLMGGPYQSLFAYDPFDQRLAASHMLIFGGTGSGKSFTTNLLLMSMCSQNPQIFIVDKGGSYKKLVEMLGGSYIDLSIPGVSFNPLEGKDKWMEREKDIALILAECIKEDEHPITAYEMTIIDRWVKTLYRSFMANPANRDKEPTFSDAYLVLTKVRLWDQDKESYLQEVQERITLLFSRWTKQGTRNQSPLANILDNEKTNVKLDSNIVAFDLLGIERNNKLMAVVFLTINNIIRSRVTDPETIAQKKIIVFDEVWSLLKSEKGALFIEELYRTMRKYNAMVLCITQDISDFADSSISSALLSNTYQYIILRQTNTANADKIKNILQLNDSETELIRSLTQVPGYYSELFLRMSGVGSGKMCVSPSPIEYWFATTKAEDKNIIENYLKQGMSLESTLSALSEKFPQGYTN